MIWLVLGILVLALMIIWAATSGEGELIIGGFLLGFIIAMIGNGIFAGTMDQSRTYEVHALKPIDANGSLIQVDDSECYFNTGSGIETVTRGKCEIVESGRGEIKITHYSPNQVWTLFTWSDYNRFYVTREQVSYGN